MKRVRIIADCNPMNPREWGYVGRMICWHDRYILGDNHEYDRENFMRQLAFEADADCDDEVDRLENEVWNRLFNCAMGNDDIVDPYEYATELVDTKVSKLIESAVLNGYVILPLYLYDHSGLTMSTGSFSCIFDSCPVGWIICDNETIKREFDGDRELAEKCLHCEVEVYDQYLTGDVYGFVIEEDGVETDSCYGFYGSDPRENGMSDHLNDELFELAIDADIEFH